MKKYNANYLVIFVLTFAYTVAVLFAQTWQECLFWMVLSLLQLQIMGRIKWKYVFIFFMLLIIPSISLFITSYLHLKNTTTGSAISIFGYNLDSYRVSMSLYLTIRAGVLSLISFSFLTAISYDRLVYSLIQNLKLPVEWGYALLAAFNSVGRLKEEYSRIKIAVQMRFSKKPLYHFYLIPLLVSAARYSQQAAMSMQTRGIDSRKSFIINEKLKLIDILILTANIVGITICMIIIKH